MQSLQKKFYNLTQGGSGNKGFIPPVFTKEHRDKISKALEGKILSDSHRRNISLSCKGREVWNKDKTGIYSQQTIDSISNSLKKYFGENGASTETRDKIANSLHGRVSPMKERSHSMEAKNKIGASVKESLSDPKVREIMSDRAKNLPTKHVPGVVLKVKATSYFVIILTIVNKARNINEKQKFVIPENIERKVIRTSKIRISVGKLSFEI